MGWSFGDNGSLNYGTTSGNSVGYLTLTKDGYFSDDGMLEGWANILPGSGTYEIRNYTLLLNYSGGRKEQLSFYSLQSPVVDKAYLNSCEIYRLK